MSTRRKSKPKEPDAAATTELERMRQRLHTDSQVLEALLSIDARPETARFIEQTRERYAQDLEELCNLQQTLLQTAETRIETLTRENQKLRGANKRLSHKFDSAKYELRKASTLWIRF